VSQGTQFGYSQISWRQFEFVLITSWQFALKKSSEVTNEIKNTKKIMLFILAKIMKFNNSNEVIKQKLKQLMNKPYGFDFL
jgi:hypothetical protein